MTTPAQVRFHQYDPVASFGVGRDDDTFRRSDGSDIFSESERPTMSDHPDVVVLRKIAFRSVRGLKRVQFDETLTDLILNSLSFIDDYRRRTADHLSSGKLRLTVCNSHGRELQPDEAVPLILASDDLHTINIVVAIMRCLPTDEQNKQIPSIVAMYYALALKEIDAALMSVKFGGDGTASYAVVALDSLNAAEALERRDDAKRTTLSEWGREAREKGLVSDPRQAEKKFVQECWEAWQKKPDLYRSKAAFAKRMIDKCEHLVSTKVIEDWCRHWGKLEGNP